MRLFKLFVVFLFCCFSVTGYGQTGTCAQATDFGFINSTSLNCGGDVVTRTFTANNTNGTWDIVNDAIKARISWGDGSAVQTATLTYLNPTIGWTGSLSHTYQDNGPTCAYDGTAQLQINGNNCSGTDVTISFTVIVYDELDNPNIGSHLIAHHATSAGAENPVTNEVDICEGDTNPIRLRDASTFNCTDGALNNPPPGSDNRNKEDRWIQWVYGTNENITGDVTIGGIVVSSFPYYGPVVHIGDDTANPNSELTLNMNMPSTAMAGEGFEVTLRSWNICNPYDDNPDLDGDDLNPVGGVFDPTVEPVFGAFPKASEAPVTTTKIIRVINKPPLPTPVDPTICTNDDLSGINFRIIGGNLAASTEVKWYDDDPNAGGVLLANPNGGNAQNFPAGAPVLGIDNTSSGTATLWASYIQGASNSCESDPVEIVLTIRPDLVDPTVTTSTATVCDGAGNVAYGIAAPAGSGVKYVWSTGGSGLTFVGGVKEGQNIQLDFNTGIAAGNTTTRTLLVRREYTNAPNCPSNFTTVNITVSGGPKATHSGDVTTCAGNPAADITWTFEGDPPFEFDYEIDDGTTVSTISETGYNSNTFTISPGAPTVETSYQIVSMTDDNSCTNTAADLGGKALVKIGSVPPTVEDIDVEAAVCDDGSTTAVPRVFIDLDLGAGESIRVNYNIDGGTTITETLTTDADGKIYISANYVDLINPPDTYIYKILNLEEVSSTCNVPIDQNFDVIINPRPADPTSPQGAIACAPDVATTTISVDDPGPGYSIDWYAGASGGVSLGNGSVFQPGTAGTYYAENSDANCVSSNRVAVTLLEDTPPSMADAGTAPAPFCETTITLGAASPAIGRGTWSVQGLLFAEHFSNNPAGTMPDGTTEDHDLYGWNVVVDRDLLTPPNDYFEVRSQQFSGRDLNQEAVWYTTTIDISSVTDVDVSLNIFENGDLEAAGTGRDYIGVYYQIDGGPENLLAPEVAGNFNNEMISGTFPTGGGSSLVIVVRMKTNADDENINFDDLIVKSSTLTIDFKDVNGPGTKILGLPVGTTPVTWTVSSAYGVCSPTQATIGLERLPPPANTDPMSEVCEDMIGSEQTEIDLTTYKNDIVGIAVAGDRTISWFDDAARTAADVIADPTAYTVNNTTRQTVYTIVTNNITNCISRGTVTFDVISLPDANDQLVKLCEDVLNGATVDGVDLTAYEEDIIAPAVPADRTVTWYEADGTTIVASPTGIDGIQDGDIYYAQVDNPSANCGDVAQLKFKVNPKPANNPIQVGGDTPASVTLCVNAIDPAFFQVSGSLNPNSTYTWTIPGTGEFVMEAGATLDNFFLPLTFPVEVAAPGLPITLMETSEDGCPGNVNTINVVVVDIPAKPVIIGVPDVCAGEENVIFKIQSANGTSQYTWNVPGTMGSIVSGQNSSQISVNIANSPGAYQVTVSELSSNGCAGPQADPYDVSVSARPQMTSGNTATICSGDIVKTYIPFTADIGSSSFSWQVISKSGPIGGTAVGNTGTGDITDVLTNASASLGQVTYEVVPNAGNCDGPGQFIFVSVEPQPDVTVSNNSPVVCDGDNIDLRITTPTAPSDVTDMTFDYAVSSTDPGNTGGTAYISESIKTFPTTLSGTLINGSDEDIVVTYTFTPKLAGCADGDPLAVNVTVEPTPKAVLVNNAPVICNGERVDIDITSPTMPRIPGDLFFDYNTTSTVTGATSGTAFINSVGRDFPANLNGTLVNSSNQFLTVTFNIKPKLNNCSDGTIASETVIVEPTPLASLVNNKTNICSGDAIDIDISSPTLVSASSVLTFDYTAVSTNPAETGGTAMTNVTGESFNTTLTGDLINTSDDDITVTYTITPVINGCTVGNPQVTTVVVEPAPKTDPVNNTPVICTGGQVDIDVNITTNASDPSKLKYDYTVSSTNASVTGGAAYSGASGILYSTTPKITGTLTNSSDEVVDVSFVITPKLDNCSDGITKTVIVRVNPTPAAVLQSNALTICNGDNFSIGVTSPTLAANMANLTYTYTVTSSNALVTGGTAFVNNTGLIFGTDNIEGTLTNSSNNSITVTYQVVPKLAGCSDGPMETLVVKVEPTPNIQVTNNSPVICNGAAINIAVATNINTTNNTDRSFSYTVSSTNDAVMSGTAFADGSGGFPAANITGALINSSTEDVTVTYTFVPLLNGCADGSPKVTNIIVEPTPAANPTNNSPLICSGGNVDILVEPASEPSDPDKLTFNYSVTSSNPSVTGGSAFGGAVGRNFPFTINGTLTNSGKDDITATYAIEPFISGCAAGTVQMVNVVVEPLPIASVPSFTPVVCNGGNVNIEVESDVVPSDPTGYTYDYTVSATDVASIGGSAYGDATGQQFGDPITGTLTNSSTAAITVTYTIVPKLNGCADGPILNKNIVVEPTPVTVINDNGLNLICSNDNVNIDITSPNMPSLPGNLTFDYTVTSNNPTATSGSAFSGSSGRSFPLNIAGSLINTSNDVIDVTFTVTPRLAGCTQGTPQSVTIQVQPKPILAVNNNNPVICNTDNVEIVVSSPSNPLVPSDLTFDYTVVSSDPAVTGGSAINSGTDVSLPFTINGDLTNNGNDFITLTYTFTPNLNGCNDGDPVVKQVIVEPTPDLSVSPVSPLCSGDAVSIQVASLTNPTAPGSLSFSLEVISSDPSATGGAAFMDLSGLNYPGSITGDLTNNSTNQITVTFRFTPELAGCTSGTVRELTVLVDPLPVANNLNKVACSDVIINKVKQLDLTALQPEINPDPTVTFSWFRDPFLNSSIADPTNHTVFNNIPIYTLVDNGTCTNVAEIRYSINAKPQVSAVVDSDYDGFGISCLEAEDGRVEATVLDAVSPLTFELLDKDKVSLGITNTTGKFGGLAAGQYHVKVTDNNGCEGITIIPAIINSPFELSGGFVFGTQNICEGEAPDKFTELSAPFGGTGNYSYQWQMSTDGVTYSNITGATSAEYQHGALATAGSYYFKRLVDTDKDCGPVESNEGLPLEVRVNPTPTMDLAFVDPKISPSDGNEISEICQGQVFYIEFKFPSGTGPFKFDYNDGTNFNTDVFGADPTRITYPNGIESDLTINITNVKDAFGCSLDLNITKTLSVIDLESEFTVLNTPICTGETVNFEYFDANGITYTWDFGDGQTESFIGSGVGVNTISHAYSSGNFNNAVDFPVRLTVDRGTCLATKIKEVRVQPSVVANIIPTAVQICSGEEITFKNSSLGSDISTWYYREKGTTQKLDEITNTGDMVKTFANNDPVKNPIIYEVVYEGRNNEGCTDSQVIEFSVYQNPDASIDYMTPIPGFVAGESQVSFINNSTIPNQSNFDYAWNFGDDADPKTLDSFNPPAEVTYSSPGQKNISFYTYNLEADAVGLTCGSEDVITINIIRPPVSADFELDPQLGCAPLTVTVTENNSQGADSFFWTVVNQLNDTVFISTDVLPQFTISRPGEYSVYLQASYDDTGQEALSQPKKIVVHVVPVASFDVRPDLVYLSEPMRTFNFSSKADTYEWDFGDGSPVVTDFDPEYTYEVEGNFKITLTAFANYNDGTVCSDSVSVMLPVQEGGSTRIPNAFTPSTKGPSPDGRIQREIDNDIFLPITKGVEEFQMLVFDRWGNLIFESNDQTVGWDGYDKNNNLLPAGVYVFKLTLRLSNGERTTRIGDITLIR